MVATVEARHLLVPLQRPIPPSAARPESAALAIHLVRMGSDDGAVAWGEAWSQDAAELDEALELLAPICIGADPLDRGVLWERMVDRLTGLAQPVPGGAAALSALDIALWDLAGHATGMPVYRMLGGRRLARLDSYATGIYLEEPEAAAQRAVELLRRGFHAIKIKFGAGPERDMAVLDAVREAVGPQVPVLVDANQAYEDRATALELGAAVDRREGFWYEEPMPPGDWRDYVALRHALDTPIAGGERLRSPGAFLEAFAMGALDVAMPDVRICGGITGLVKVAELARWFGVRISPHNWASQLATVASAHAAVTLTNCLMTEVEATVRPVSGRLLDPPLQLEDGFVVLPEGPGLGVRVDEGFVAQFAT